MPQPAVQDHDRRFKELLRNFLPELVALVRPKWVGNFRFEDVEWLRQEIFWPQNEGKRRLIDMIGKVPLTKPTLHPDGQRQSHFALIHIEPENSKSIRVKFRARMSHYHTALEETHDLPVFSIAVLLRVGLKKIGWDRHIVRLFEDEVRRIRWRYLGLPAMDGLAYSEGSNLLGVALSPLMNVPADKRLQVCAGALRKIAASDLSDRKRFLLAECVQAYAKLSRPEWEQFLASLSQPDDYAGADEMVSLVFEEGVAKGEAKGEAKGLRKGQQLVAANLLKLKFPDADQATLDAVRSLDEDQIQALLPQILSASSLDALSLPQPASPSEPRFSSKDRAKTVS